MTLKPSLHLLIVTKDKVIHLYAIVKDLKFDVGYVIKRNYRVDPRVMYKSTHPPFFDHTIMKDG